ncbi:MAG: LPS export ABC transporter periplasmic protein LptC [Gemmatimonadota bacterium]
MATRIGGVLSLTLVLLSGGGAVAGCDKEPVTARTVPLPTGKPGMPTPDQVVENGEHIITVQGVKKAVLTSEQLYFYNQNGRVYGDTIQVNFFDPAGGQVSMLTAQTGEIDQATQEMIARGNVVVRSPTSMIKTEALRYDPAANRIISDQPTEITQEGNVIRGQGVETDPALKDIRITGGSAVLRSEPRMGADPASAPPQTDGGLDGIAPAPPPGETPPNATPPE